MCTAAVMHMEVGNGVEMDRVRKDAQKRLGKQEMDKARRNKSEAEGIWSGNFSFKYLISAT
jgi:hypothetical protein